MEKINAGFKIFISLFLVVVFSWLVTITRYEYKEYKGAYIRINRITGKMEAKTISRTHPYAWEELMEE